MGSNRPIDTQEKLWQKALPLGRYFCVIHFCVIHPIFKEIDEVTQSVIQNFAVTYSVILAVIYSVILFFQ